VKNISAILIQFLQGYVVTQIVLGGLAMYYPVANFLQYMCAKNYENWLRVHNVAMKNLVQFLAHPVYPLFFSPASMLLVSLEGLWLDV